MAYAAKTYEYRRSYLFMSYGWAAFLAASWIAIGFFFYTGLKIDIKYIYPTFATIVPILIVIWSSLTLYRRHLSIKIIDNGITSHSFNKIKNFIAWKEITKIERIRYFSYMATTPSGYIYVYLVYAGKKQIRFDENLQDIRGLLDEINVYIKKYNIETISYDRGVDTLRKARTANMDENKRKEILNNGVIEKLTAL